MKKMHILIFCFLIFVSAMNAQCGHGRFHNFVFLGQYTYFKNYVWKQSKIRWSNASAVNGYL
jgi:hypothetical protein